MRNIRICTHAFYEAIKHASGRLLYGRPVTDFPHVKQMFLDAYASQDLPNVKIFSEQVKVFRDFLLKATPDAAQRSDIDFLLAVGEIFTLVAYGQLILENASLLAIPDDLVEQIFDFMVRDLSRFAVILLGKPSSTEAQMAFCLTMIRKAHIDEARSQRVLEAQVYSQKGAYVMAE